MPGRSFQQGNNKAAKLTGEQVMEIRERYATERGLSQPMLAREYDVSKNTVANILNGTTWRHLLRGEEAQVYRPPLNARPPTTPDESVLRDRLFARLDAQQSNEVKAPSLYDSPPPTLAEDEAAGQLGFERLNKELDGPQARKAKEISDELGKLEKGD